MSKEKLKNLLIRVVLVFLIIVVPVNSHAGWYEEPEVYETKNIDSMWWLSKSKKEKLKNEQKEEIEKEKAENISKRIEDKKIKWLYDDNDITRFPKDKWEVIDEDNDGIAYNYYFDKEGYLFVDTITPDYKIVDKKGRETDYNLKAVKYSINQGNGSNIKVSVSDEYITSTKPPANILIGEGVVIRKKEKIYDNTLNKNVVDYIDKSNRFIKETRGTIYNEVKWKKCSSLKGNGGYVIFNNPSNNFNKISGYIAIEYNAYDVNTNIILKAYDADLYDELNDKHILDDIEEIYINSSIDKAGINKFSFTFDRSIKRIRFEVEVYGESKSLTCFIKDLKYSFSKKSFYDELIRKKEDEEELEELKRLGIYVENMWSFESLDENGEEIYEDDEETEHENENNDDRIGGISYVSDEETKNYEDVVRDRNTGPAFDENLKNIKEVGPGIITVE